MERWFTVWATCWAFRKPWLVGIVRPPAKGVPHVAAGARCRPALRFLANPAHCCFGGSMTPRHNPEVWPVVHDERLALLRDLENLSAKQWETQSLCPGWDVHDVLAHLTDSAKTTRWGFIRRMVLAGFDFDKDNAVGIATQRCVDPAQTLAGFRDVLGRTSTPPAAPATRLVEAFVHGEDIRRPLGMRGDYPASPVAKALAYQLRTSVKMGGGKERAAGYTLVATDTTFGHGAGQEVHGKAIALLLAVSGRPVAPDELTGPGAEAFVERTRG